MLSRRSVLRLLSVVVLVGCGGPAGTPIENQTVTAACGMCLFSMREAKGCMWAVEIEGTPYLVQGALPRDHENHSPDGMCNVKRQVVVDGHLREDRFVATRFDLLPAESVPEKPTFSPEDVHP
jgi:hypothetical protein